jgi:hypothetical protein
VLASVFFNRLFFFKNKSKTLHVGVHLALFDPQKKMERSPATPTNISKDTDVASVAF